ncbi:hypothetical protein [Brumimicrobium mesophilum]|uniref:hypothetical protein n=1 Tax=Brumimicrobium mesophilum TaxID=392717 RepID=UPI00131E7A87|nr:hypothetical protein [Brumimicrobium mesophilum]
MINKKLTLKEILIAIGLLIPTYFIIAIFNISNEDLYNNDIDTIFSQGSFMNKTAYILFWIWLIIIILWGLSIINRFIKQLKSILKN